MLATRGNVQTTNVLLHRLYDARNRSDELFGIVRPEALYERPIGERHRIVFYIGHLEAFDWNLLRDRILHRQSFHPEFDHLFAFGIDPVDGGLPNDQPSDWPLLPRVREYVQRVRDEIDDGLSFILENSNDEDDAHSDGDYSVEQLLNVAIEHRLMHAETLAYMLHQLPFSRKVSPGKRDSVFASSSRSTNQSRSEMIDSQAGPITLGLPRNGQTFGWDNEFEAHTEQVPAFSIDRFKVTIAEYLQFITSGGYENRSLWTDENWNWKESARISHPVFWVRKDNVWFWRGMFEDVPLPLDWPVYVSHAEASAFACWAGKSLPSEAQWQRAAYGSPKGQRDYPWGEEAPNPSLGNFDFARWEPVAVGSYPDAASAFGVQDIVGNGWEWTSTPFQPFPGFVPFSFYPGYSANFFDGKHYVMKGGSSRTAACMLRSSFRNWFQARYQFVYSGFRCVRNHEGA